MCVCVCVCECVCVCAYVCVCVCVCVFQNNYKLRELRVRHNKFGELGGLYLGPAIGIKRKKKTTRKIQILSNIYLSHTNTFFYIWFVWIMV
jgi:hypothetical protein